MSASSATSNGGSSVVPTPNQAAGEFDLALPERTAPALLLSLALHVLLLTTMGLVWSRKSKGTGGDEDRDIGIALVHQMPDRDRFVDAAELNPAEPNEESQTEPSESAAASAPPADLSPPIDLNGILKAMESTPSPVSGSGLAGETALEGDAFGSDLGSGKPSDASETTTHVFGISGSGSRFVYVFDRSDSMNGHGGKPLRAAKTELLRSLSTLTDRQRFQIVFYNDKPTPFRIEGMPTQMVAGEPALRSAARRHVNSIAAFGGTEHGAALKMALRLSPDVIFFLTDARIPRLSGSELREIQARADRGGTTIHAIEFGADAVAPADSFLRTLAAMNRGQYQYVDVRRLKNPLIQPADKEDAPHEDSP